MNGRDLQLILKFSSITKSHYQLGGALYFRIKFMFHLILSLIINREKLNSKTYDGEIKQFLGLTRGSDIVRTRFLPCNDRKSKVRHTLYPRSVNKFQFVFDDRISHSVNETRRSTRDYVDIKTLTKKRSVYMGKPSVNLHQPLSISLIGH